MPEDSGGRPLVSRVELGTSSSAYRNAAVDYSEYFAIYQLGRGEYDNPEDRINELNRMAAANAPIVRDTFALLDAHLERAMVLRNGFYTGLTPSTEIDPMESEAAARRVFDAAHPWQSRDLLNGLHGLVKSPRRDVSSGTPPDYTFSSVRHPIARPLLELLNIAMVVDDEVVNDPKLRAEKLKENGKKMVIDLIGENANPVRLLRIKELDVLAAVFAGVIRLPEVPGEPLSADKSLGHQELDGELNGTDH